MPAKPIKRWILWGVPVIFLVASPLHFVFEWTSSSPVVGIFAPVNESPWEHLKLVYWPMLLWWMGGYLLLRKQPTVSARKWFVSAAAAIVATPVLILALFYLYSGALGVESLIADIVLLGVAVALAHALALHVFRYADPGRAGLILAVAVIVALAAVYVACTFAAPHLPVFQDSNTGQYGI